MSLGDDVAAAVTGKVGSRAVGDGECFALVDWALKGAGARSAEDFGKITATADYVWGDAVGLDDLKVGDLLQFRDYFVKTRTENSDGTWREATDTRPHHSAVVEAVSDDGSVTLVEQNVGRPAERRKVRRAVLPRLAAGSETRTKGESTVTITVTGTVSAYRPVARPRKAALFDVTETERRMFASYSRDDGGPKRAPGPVGVG
jgi:hypothetical protein